MVEKNISSFKDMAINRNDESEQRHNDVHVGSNRKLKHNSSYFAKYNVTKKIVFVKLFVLK